MATLYRYKAIDQQGQIRNDVIEADNPLELEQRLQSMGFDLIRFKEQKGRHVGLSFKRKTVSRADLINFAFDMEQMTRSGVPILEGLKDLRDSMVNIYFKEILTSVIDDIQGGKTFSQSLEVHSRVFDNVFITLVRVGEESGRLSEVLHDLAETLKWQDELISHTKKIMIYPTLVSIVVFSVVTFLMIYLIPKLVPFIKDMGGEIPFYTTALIATSNFFVDYWYLVIGVPILVTMMVKYYASKNPKFRYKLDSFKLRIWLFGPLLLKIKLARFSNYMAMMYTSGITVLNSLEISKDLVDNMVLSHAIKSTSNRISEGDSISSSFSEVDIFPPLVIRMIRVGENTGALDTALMNVSYFYNREVKEAIEKIEPTIGPALTIVLGGIMMWIMLAVLGPVYDTISNLKI